MTLPPRLRRSEAVTCHARVTRGTADTRFSHCDRRRSLNAMPAAFVNRLLKLLLPLDSASQPQPTRTVTGGRFRAAAVIPSPPISCPGPRWRRRPRAASGSRRLRRSSSAPERTPLAGDRPRACSVVTPGPGPAQAAHSVRAATEAQDHWHDDPQGPAGSAALREALITVPELSGQDRSTPAKVPTC